MYSLPKNIKNLPRKHFCILVEESHFKLECKEGKYLKLFVCLCVQKPWETHVPMNTSHFWKLCRYAAKFHVPADLNLLSTYHVPNHPVGISIPAAI